MNRDMTLTPMMIDFKKHLLAEFHPIYDRINLPEDIEQGDPATTWINGDALIGYSSKDNREDEIKEAIEEAGYAITYFETRNRGQYFIYKIFLKEK